MIASFARLVSRWPSERAQRVASVVGLVALAIMVAGILFPAPLLVVAGMSVAQVLGGVAFLLYLFSVAAEYRQDVAVPGPSATKHDEKPETT